MGNSEAKPIPEIPDLAVAGAGEISDLVSDVKAPRPLVDRGFADLSPRSDSPPSTTPKPHAGSTKSSGDRTVDRASEVRGNLGYGSPDAVTGLLNVGSHCVVSWPDNMAKKGFKETSEKQEGTVQVHHPKNKDGKEKSQESLEMLKHIQDKEKQPTEKYSRYECSTKCIHSTTKTPGSAVFVNNEDIKSCNKGKVKEKVGNSFQYPQRPGVPSCQFYMKTGTCKYETNCKFNHPLIRKKDEVKTTKVSEVLQVNKADNEPARLTATPRTCGGVELSFPNGTDVDKDASVISSKKMECNDQSSAEWPQYLASNTETNYSLHTKNVICESDSASHANHQTLRRTRKKAKANKPVEVYQVVKNKDKETVKLNTLPTQAKVVENKGKETTKMNTLPTQAKVVENKDKETIKLSTLPTQAKVVENEDKETIKMNTLPTHIKVVENKDKETIKLNTLPTQAKVVEIKGKEITKMNTLPTPAKVVENKDKETIKLNTLPTQPKNDETTLKEVLLASEEENKLLAKRQLPESNCVGLVAMVELPIDGMVENEKTVEGSQHLHSFVGPICRPDMNDGSSKSLPACDQSNPSKRKQKKAKASKKTNAAVAQFNEDIEEATLIRQENCENNIKQPKDHLFQKMEQKNAMKTDKQPNDDVSEKTEQKNDKKIVEQPKDNIVQKEEQKKEKVGAFKIAERPYDDIVSKIEHQNEKKIVEQPKDNLLQKVEQKKGKKIVEHPRNNISQKVEQKNDKKFVEQPEDYLLQNTEQKNDKISEENGKADDSERDGKLKCEHNVSIGCISLEPGKCYVDKKKDTTSQLNFLDLPLRPGKKECPEYMTTGNCKYALKCKYHHPDPTASSEQDLSSECESGQPTQEYLCRISSVPLTLWPMQMAQSVPSRFEDSWGLNFSAYPVPETCMQTPSVVMNPNKNKSAVKKNPWDKYPQRPGQRECRPFMETGSCKFKSACKYHHPRYWLSTDRDGSLNSSSPQKTEQRPCTTFKNHGSCKNGSSCRFHHSTVSGQVSNEKHSM